MAEKQNNKKTDILKKTLMPSCVSFNKKDIVQVREKKHIDKFTEENKLKQVCQKTD
jgi:hypothetical protein